MKLTYLIFALLLIPAHAHAAANSPGAGAATDWVLNSLSEDPELAAFFGNADAILTTKKETKENPEAIRPTVFVYKLKKKPAGKLTSSKEWLAFVAQYLKNDKRVVLSEDASTAGRYILEFTSRNPGSDTDLRSLYLAIQSADGSVSLFVYDGLGPSTSRNLPLVRSLYGTLDGKVLADMHSAGARRRANKKH